VAETHKSNAHTLSAVVSLASSKEDKAAMRRLKRPGAALKPDYE